MLGHARQRALHLVVLEQAAAVANQVIDTVIAERVTEVLRRDIFELVRFVDHERGRRRDHLAVCALAHRRVRTQQVMVDDDDVGFGGALAHASDEAVVVAEAFGAEAGVRLRGHLLPQRHVFRQIAQLRAVARLRLARPRIQHRQQYPIARVDESPAR